LGADRLPRGGFEVRAALERQLAKGDKASIFRLLGLFRVYFEAFEAIIVRILGVLLDAVAEGLKRLPDTHLPKLPRMADFALWATACETALWPADTFSSAYCGNRDEAVDTTLLEALNRHRGKGQQKVTVEHVHVHSGGQAIVGMVEGGAKSSDPEETQDAKQIAYAPQPAMRSTDAE
jgi:hypothetical protein